MNNLRFKSSLRFPTLFAITTMWVLLLSTAQSNEEIRRIESHVLDLVNENQKAVVGINGGGSGVIVSADGLVLTAAHVVNGRNPRCVVQLPDGRELEAVRLGMNLNRDAAMVQIKEEGPWPFAEIRFEAMKPAEWVVAMGHPQGFSDKRLPPVRFGRIIKPHRDTFGPLGFMMSDCTITGGDSGGPLFDIKGRVVGIHSFVSSDLWENFHVPMSVFKKDWDKIFEGEKWGTLAAMDERPTDPSKIHRRPKLGIVMEPHTTRDGVVIQDVVKDSPAMKSGLKVGDHLLTIEDRNIRSYKDVHKILEDYTPGEEITLNVKREEKDLELDLVLGKGQPFFQQTEDWNSLIEEMQKGWEIPKKFEEGMLGLVDEAQRSTVAIMDGAKRIAHGTILSADGWILTKASESGNSKSLNIKTSDGQKFSASWVDSIKSLDLALLKADSGSIELSPIDWPESKIEESSVGSFVASPTVTEEKAVYLGVVSVKERHVERDKGFLGVALGANGERIFVAGLVPDCPAQKAGIQRFDHIVQVNDVSIEDVDQAIQTIGQYEPGEKVLFTIKRGDKELEFNVVLGSRVNQMPIAFNMEGGKFSKIRAGFEKVIQHDIPLAPEDCGGPLVSTEGDLIGINIARSSRIRSFALPMSIITPYVIENEDGSWSLSKPRKDLEKELSQAEKDLKEAKLKLLEIQNKLKSSDYK